MSDSLLEFAGKMHRLTDAVGDIPKSATGKVAFATKRIIKAQAPDRLRNVGRKGARLDVRYTVRAVGAEATALVFATGPWPIIESDTPAHVIPRQRVRGKRRVIVIPGVGVRAYAHHPGTKGKHPFARGREEAAAIAPRVFQAELGGALVSIF